MSSWMDSVYNSMRGGAPSGSGGQLGWGFGGGQPGSTGVSVAGIEGTPASSASDWYRSMKQSGDWLKQQPGHQGQYQAKISGWLPPAYNQSFIPNLTNAQVAHMMANPYSVPDAALRSNLQGVEQAYNRAGGTVAASTLGSGAGEGNVAKGFRGNVELGRAGAVSDALRDWEQFKIQQGDERIRSIGLPWMQQYIQAHNVAPGVSGAGRPQGTNQWGGNDTFWRNAAGYLGEGLNTFTGGMLKGLF